MDNKQIFSKNLKHQISRSRKDRRQIAEELEIPYSTFTEWINGNKYPRIERIEKLAAYFGVPKYAFIEDLDSMKKDNDRLAVIIAKLRTNKEFVDVVERLVTLENPQLKTLDKFLDLFI